MREDAARQPYQYVRTELVEPDWRRLPGWREVTTAQWRDAQWQRAHSVKNPRQLRAVVGDRLSGGVYGRVIAGMARDSTMSMLRPPQVLQTVAPAGSGGQRSVTVELLS